MQRKLKAVIDTNLFVSGLFARDSLSARLQDMWINQDFELVTSIEIIKEISRVLNYPRIKEHFKPTEENIRRFYRLIFRKAIISKDIYQTDKIADDPTDNKFWPVLWRKRRITSSRGTLTFATSNTTTASKLWMPKHLLKK